MNEKPPLPKKPLAVDQYSIHDRLAIPQLEGTWVTAPLIRIHDLFLARPVCGDYEESRRRAVTLPADFSVLDKKMLRNINSKSRRIDIQYGDPGYDFPPHVPITVRQEQQMIDDSTISDSIQCSIFFPWGEEIEVSQGYNSMLNQVAGGIENEHALRRKQLSLHYAPWQYQFDWVLRRVVHEAGDTLPVETLFYTENSLVRDRLVACQSYWQPVFNCEADNLNVDIRVCDEGKLGRIVIGREVNYRVDSGNLHDEIAAEKAVLLEYNLDEDSKLKGKLQFAMSGTKVRRLTPDRLIMDQIKIPITQQPEGIVYLFIPSEINTESLFRNIMSGKSGLSFRTDVPYNG